MSNNYLTKSKHSYLQYKKRNTQKKFYRNEDLTFRDSLLLKKKWKEIEAEQPFLNGHFQITDGILEYIPDDDEDDFAVFIKVFFEHPDLFATMPASLKNKFFFWINGVTGNFNINKPDEENHE